MDGPDAHRRQDLLQATRYCVLDASQRPRRLPIPTTVAPAKALRTVPPLVFDTGPPNRPAAPACLLASITHAAPLGIFQSQKPRYPVPFLKPLGGFPLCFGRKFKRLCSPPLEAHL